MLEKIEPIVKDLFHTAKIGKPVPRLEDRVEALFRAPNSEVEFWETTAALIEACKRLTSSLETSESRKVLCCIGRSWAVRCADKLRAQRDHSRPYAKNVSNPDGETLNTFTLNLLRAHADDLNQAFWPLVVLNHRLATGEGPGFEATFFALQPFHDQRKQLSDPILKNVESALRGLRSQLH